MMGNENVLWKCEWGLIVCTSISFVQGLSVEYALKDITSYLLF